MTYRNLQTDQLIADYQTGMGAYQIARHYGVSHGCVYYRLLQAGVTIRPSTRVRARTYPVDQWIADYQTGMSLRQIADRYDVSGWWIVHHALIRAGVAMRPAGPYPRPRDKHATERAWGKTHCKYGHLLAGDNLCPRVGKTPPRCRECHKAAMLRHYYAKRAMS